MAHLLWFFALVYLVEGLGQIGGLISQPLNYYLKQVQGWTPLQITAYLTLFNLPWIIKPLYGLVSDFIPLFGYRRKSYLLIASAAATCGFLLVSQLSMPDRLVFALMLTAYAMAISSTLCGAVLVENGQRLKESGTFVNQQWLWYNIAAMTAAIVGGQLVENLLPTAALHTAAALVSGWRLDRFGQLAAGPGLAELRAGQTWAVPGGDVVSSAPELARLTLNVAIVHHDAQAGGGRRLVYGGHTIGLALAQAVRSLPSLVTVAAWHGCDHLGPVHEGDTLRSTISVEQVDPLPGGGGLVHLRSQVRAQAPGGDDGLGWPAGAISPSGLGWPGGDAGRDRHEGSAPRDVLDWRYIAVIA